MTAEPIQPVHVARLEGIAETGSVAMKNAPSRLAPDERWKTGPAYAPGSAAAITDAHTNNAPSIATGMCQRMMRSASNHTPPARVARLIHSQPLPPKVLNNAPACASPIVMPSARSVRSASSGVGEVIASQVKRAGGEPVRIVVRQSMNDSDAGSNPTASGGSHCNSRAGNETSSTA
jgi:hypothetical protein